MERNFHIWTFSEVVYFALGLLRLPLGTEDENIGEVQINRPLTFRPRTLRLHWLLLTVLTLLVIAGTFAAHVSSSPTMSPLRLAPGESITVSVFRFFPHAVSVSLRFSHSKGTPRPELGSGNPQRIGADYVEYESSGEPVIVQVEAAARTVLYEARPAGSISANHIYRDLYVLEPNRNPSRFRRPPDHASRPMLSSGRSTVKITVLEVGTPLMDEQVMALVNAPLSFKNCSPGYCFLGWFLLWPVLAVLLLIYAAVLLFLTLWSLSDERDEA